MDTNKSKHALRQGENDPQGGGVRYYNPPLPTTHQKELPPTEQVKESLSDTIKESIFHRNRFVEDKLRSENRDPKIQASQNKEGLSGIKDLERFNIQRHQRSKGLK